MASPASPKRPILPLRAVSSRALPAAADRRSVATLILGVRAEVLNFMHDRPRSQRAYWLRVAGRLERVERSLVSR